MLHTSNHFAAHPATPRQLRPQLPPLSLYLHIPWCVQKCPYCDFNSHALEGALPEQAYSKALLQDLDAELDRVQGRSIGSVFFGGGTPSLFSAAAIGRLVEGIARRLHIDRDAEITLEANPGTVTAAKFAGFRAAGINRLSLGVQSFGDASLRALGRIHDGNTARQAVRAAHQAGFSRLNVDLMYALPSQTPRQATADLQQALALEPEHISWYALTIEPNTVFYRQRPALPAEDALHAIQQQGEAVLRDGGYRPYEVSAWSQPGGQARHNLNYWHFGDYLGIGAGAHGKITDPAAGCILRTRKTRAPADYLRRIANGASGAGSPDSIGSNVVLGREELPLEFMMNALRLEEGVSAVLFEERTGLALADIDRTLAELRQHGLLQNDPARIQTTPLGRRFLNDVLAKFIPPDRTL